MPRLLGVDIPDKKRVEYALAYLFGVGLTRARVTVAQCKIDPAKKAGDLTPEEIRQAQRNALEIAFLTSGEKAALLAVKTGASS